MAVAVIWFVSPILQRASALFSFLSPCPYNPINYLYFLYFNHLFYCFLLKLLKPESLNGACLEPARWATANLATFPPYLATFPTLLQLDFFLNE